MRSRIALALLTVVAVAVLVEGAARVGLFFFRGQSTVGLYERNQQLQYEPFTMFGPKWDSVLGPSAARPKPRAFRVLLLGASTAASFPAEILAHEIAATRGEPVDVVNAAYGGYNARQELVLASLWAAVLEPDVVLTLDGANDLIHRIHGAPAQAFYLDDAYRLSLTRPMTAPFAHLLRHSQAFQSVKRLVERRRLASADVYADAIPAYVQAHHSLNVLARGLPARRVVVLQPFLAFKQPLSADEARFSRYRYRETVVKELYARTHERLQSLAATDGVVYVDARGAFDGQTETVFVDEVHFVSDDAYRPLARYIVKAAGREVWTTQR